MAGSVYQKFSDFSVATNFATFPLKVDGKTLFVNPNTIAEMSPVFAAMMFNKGFKEQKEQAIFIKDESYEDLLEMFRCILPAPKNKWQVKPITVATFPKMFELADKYGFSILTAYCESFIEDTFEFVRVDANQLIDILESAVNYSLSEECMNIIVKRAAEWPFFELKKSTLAESNLPAYIVTRLLFAQVEREKSRADEEKCRADREKSRADQEERRANAERDRANNEKQLAKDAQSDLRFAKAEKTRVETELVLAKKQMASWLKSDLSIGSAAVPSRRL